MSSSEHTIRRVEGPMPKTISLNIGSGHYECSGEDLDYIAEHFRRFPLHILRQHLADRVFGDETRVALTECLSRSEVLIILADISPDPRLIYTHEESEDGSVPQEWVHAKPIYFR